MTWEHATGAVLSQERVETSPTRNPLPTGPARTVRPRQGSGHRRCDAHPGRHSRVDRRPGWSLPSHASGQPEDVLSRPCRGRTSRPPPGSTPDTDSGCGTPSIPSRSPPGWTSRGCSGGSVPTHTRTIKGRRHVEVVYRVCSLLMYHAQPEAIAAWTEAPEPLSPQPPDPCQDAPNELSDH